MRDFRTNLVARLDRRATYAAGVLCVLVLFAWTVFGARAASGADTLGYVSQAYLWVAGDLRIERPLSAEVPWTHAAASLAPLGYRPRGGSVIVPTYPSGLPVMMAAFALVFGDCGPYLVVPLCAIAVLCGTFMLANRLTNDRVAAFVACALMATSPVFLFHSMVPMSDVPTTALWVVSLLALTWPSALAAGCGGAAAGLAILIRPNLVPLVAAGVAAAALWNTTEAPRRQAMRRVAAYLAVGVIPAASFVALVNRYLYGSPFRSGYGPTETLYSWVYLPTNVRQFSTWLAANEGAVLAIALAAFVVSRPRLSASRLVPPVLFAALNAASYLFYQPHPGWTYLRFVLPAFPLLMIGAAIPIVGAMRRSPRYASLLLIVTVALAGGRLVPHVFEIGTVGPGEHRYPAVADFIGRALPEQAVFIAMQHSGTIAVYAGRPIVRYDWLRSGELALAVDWLRKQGLHPYIVLEEWEEPSFRSRFDRDGATGRLALRVIGQVDARVGVRIYDALEPSPVAGAPFPIRPRRECAGPSPRWPARAVN